MLFNKILLRILDKMAVWSRQSSCGVLLFVYITLSISKKHTGWRSIVQFVTGDRCFAVCLSFFCLVLSRVDVTRQTLRFARFRLVLSFTTIHAFVRNCENKCVLFEKGYLENKSDSISPYLLTYKSMIKSAFYSIVT